MGDSDSVAGHKGPAGVYNKVGGDVSPGSVTSPAVERGGFNEEQIEKMADGAECSRAGDGIRRDRGERAGTRAEPGWWTTRGPADCKVGAAGHGITAVAAQRFPRAPG